MWGMAGGGLMSIENKKRVIEAAYKVSNELGKEVEAIAERGANPGSMERLRALVEREFGNHRAALIYETLLAALLPPG